MRPIAFFYTPAPANTSGFLAGATGAGPFTPTATTSGDSLSHLFTIDTGDNLSAITFTVVGKDPSGAPQTEAITGPNATTATGTLYWSEVTSISASATLGLNAADFGWDGESVSHPVILSYLNETFSVGMGVSVTGTINYTVQHTFTDLFDKTLPYSPIWYNHSSLVALATTADGNYAYNLIATRLKINSITDGATVIWEIIQGTGTT